jgi:Uma2 family endonuclease
VTISDDRLTSPKFLAFMQKLVNHHYWTADDYDTIPDELVVEIYDGVIHMVPSASPDHQSTSLALAISFVNAVGERRRVYQDVDVNVLGKIYKPDLIVVREDTDKQPVPGDLVQVAVEILSKNENIERSAKKAAYAAQGIPLYLVVGGDKGQHFAEVYTLVDGKYELFTTVPAGIRTEFSEPFPFVLDMKQINS